MSVAIAELICQRCSKPFYRERHVVNWGNPVKYCSDVCRSRAVSERMTKAEFRTCPCGVKFVASQHQIGIGQGTHCSQRCRGVFETAKTTTAANALMNRPRLPTVLLSQRRRIDGQLWWAGLPTICQQSHCGGRLMVRPPETDTGEVACHLCSRIVAVVGVELR